MCTLISSMYVAALLWNSLYSILRVHLDAWEAILLSSYRECGCVLFVRNR